MKMISKYPLNISVIFIVMFLFLAGQGICQQQGTFAHLARAIELYNAGDYEASFDETTRQVEITENCALAYYYRALIRARWSDFRRAGLSLEAALRDSSGFTDAVGLNAYVLRHTGKSAEALDEWKKFTAAVGMAAEEVTLDAIMLPDDYRAKLAGIESAPVPKRETAVSSVISPSVETPVAALPPEEAVASPDVQSDAVDKEMSGDDLPMSVIDFLEMIDSSNSTVTEARNTPTVAREGGSLVNSFLRYGVPVVVLFFLVVFIRRRSTRLRAAPLSDMVEYSVEVVPEIKESSDIYSLGFIEHEIEEEENLPDTPYNRAMKLRRERRKNTLEIERLLKKV